MVSSDPAPIGTLIGQLASRYRWQRRFSRRAIWKSWRELTGNAISEHSWPLKFRGNDILVIAVSDSVWMQQLSLQKLTVLESLNRMLPPESRIRDMRFEIGDIDEVRKNFMPVSARHAADAKAMGKNHSTELSHENTRQVKKQAEALTEPVRDRELKKMLERVYLKSRTKNR
jgi:predicted nucleic acid-binding Zn ribbon protein